MDSLINVFSTGLGLLIAIAMWAILFVVIREALRRASPFSGWTVPVLAVCVALLCVIGVFRVFVGANSPADTPETEDPYGFLLFPYALLGISILGVLLLILFIKAVSSKGEQGHDEVRRRDEADASARPEHQPEISRPRE